MKSADILKVLAEDLGTADLAEVNKLLKAKSYPKIKYTLLGKKLGFLGYTVVIKAVTAEGLKIYDVNRVSLIRFEDIESFAKAKAKTIKPERKKVVAPTKARAPKIRSKKIADDDEDDEDAEGEDHETEDEEFPRRKRPSGGSMYIPRSRKS